jgi:hypothetical protein
MADLAAARRSPARFTRSSTAASTFWRIAGAATADRGAQAPTSRMAEVPQDGIALNELYKGDCAIIYKHAGTLGCQGTVCRQIGLLYRSGRSDHWLGVKSPATPAGGPR